MERGSIAWISQPAGPWSPKAAARRVEENEEDADVKDEGVKTVEAEAVKEAAVEESVPQAPEEQVVQQTPPAPEPIEHPEQEKPEATEESKENNGLSPKKQE